MEITTGPSRVFEALGARISNRTSVLFSVPASETMYVVLAAVARGTKLYAARHEQGAIGMADGYARASGRVGVVLVGRGPGLTNGLNAMITARKARSSVVVLAGEVPAGFDADPVRSSRHLLSSKTVNQRGYLTALGFDVLTIDSAETADATLLAALDRAAAGNVVVVLIRGDVSQLPATEMSDSVATGSHELSGAQSQADDAGIDALGQILSANWAAQRPLILAGRGAISDRAAKGMERLGEAIGALMGTTLLARSLFADAAWNIGVVGVTGSAYANGLVSRSDLIISFGASLNQFTTFGGELFEGKFLVQIDTDEQAIGGYLPADLGIVGDAAMVAERVSEQLEQSGHHSSGARTEPTSALLADGRRTPEFKDASRPGRLDPRTAARRLDEAVPAVRNLVFDNGAHIAFGFRYLSVAQPGDLYPNHYYGSVGAGLGVAIGVAIARPDRPTLLSAGDGGLMMALPDLDTAVRYHLPLIVFVNNDGGFGQEFHLLNMAGLSPDIACYQNPSFAAAAEGLGATGITIRTEEDFAALSQLVETGLTGPVVVDCPITLDVVPDMVGLVQRLGHSHT